MWSDTHMALLSQVLDELIPPSQDGRVPGAGSIGLADFLAKADSFADNPVETVRRVLDFLSGRTEDFGGLSAEKRIELLRQAERELAGEFGTLLRLTYMGYYSRAEIRPLFGLGEQPVHPEGYPVERESEEEMDILTAPVRARGAVYRDPADREAGQ